MKTNLFIIMLILLCSCTSQKPIATAHIERIEERLKPIAIGADTIEITLSHTDNYRLTENNISHGTHGIHGIRRAPPADNSIINDFEQSKKSNFIAKGSKTVGSVDSVDSVRDKNSVRNKNSVRVKSTRAINIQQTKTDTTSTLRITLRPDTVYLPYTTHIRSDTIIVQDKICKTKLQKTQTASVVLILILIAVIIFFIKRQKYRRT